MDTDYLALRGGLQSKGIVVAQVLLGSKRQFRDVFDGLNVIGTNVHLLQLIAIERNIMVHILYNFV